MDILVLNQDWFTSFLREAGHRVVTCGLGDNMEIRLEAPVVHIDTVVKIIGRDFSPERILILDNSAPIVVTGLEESPIPSYFFSVDVFHHFDLHCHLYQIFDGMAVAQKDFVEEFAKLGANVEWLPLWASRVVEPEAEKTYGAVFVGTLNAKLNPDRVKFFEALAERVPVLFKSGNWWEIFRKAEIVINQTVKSDVNFRVFEGMISGSCLLTESSGNGLLDLFEPDKHLVTYEKNNVAEAADKIQALLADRSRCRRTAKAGREEVLRAHCEQHRAAWILERLRRLEKRPAGKQKFFSAMANYAALGQRLEKLDTSLAIRAFVATMKAAESALSAGEELDSHLACLLIAGAFRYDQKVGSDAGARLLVEAADAYPGVPLMRLAHIRTLLNCGDLVRAEALAREMSPSKEPAEVFNISDGFVTDLLRME